MSGFIQLLLVSLICWLGFTDSDRDKNIRVPYMGNDLLMMDKLMAGKSQR